MLLNESCLDGIIGFGDIEDKGHLVTSELEEVTVDISQGIRTFDSKVIEIRGSVSEGAV